MPDIHNHDHAETLLDDYVMGTLSDADLSWMDAHIPTCDICQQEVPLLLEGTLALGWSVDEPPVEMSGNLWSRIEQNLTVSAEDAVPTPVETSPAPVQGIAAVPLPDNDAPATRERPQPLPAPREWVSQNQYRWLATAALVLIAIGIVAIAGRALWWADDDTPAQEIALHDADGNVIGNDVATLDYMPDDERFVLRMADMPEAPDGQVYQAWLIAGDVPTPMGIVDPATGEFSVEGDRASYDAFAITMEPGPDGSDLPTSDPIVVAPLADGA